jgi:hypothetical protein
MRELLEHLKDVCLIIGLLILSAIVFYYFGFWIVLAFIGYLLYTTFLKK